MKIIKLSNYFNCSTSKNIKIKILKIWLSKTKIFGILKNIKLT